MRTIDFIHTTGAVTVIDCHREAVLEATHRHPGTGPAGFKLGNSGQ